MPHDVLKKNVFHCTDGLYDGISLLTVSNLLEEASSKTDPLFCLSIKFLTQTSSSSHERKKEAFLHFESTYRDVIFSFLLF